MKRTGSALLTGFIALIATSLTAGLGEAPRASASAAAAEVPGQSLLAGRNVNMVSGTKLPFGDPWLQRQNEPSIAASTRNPLHLLGGANDYRTIDVPEDLKLPGIERSAAADAWLGVYESFDGGESWITTLLPGFPQDASLDGQASPLRNYETACDPIVRAGANGLFYYCGIAFNRTTKESAIFVSRFVDDNNREKVELVNGPDGQLGYAGPIGYVDTRLIATGSTGSSFIDMPNLAVDVPRGNARYGAIYAAYTVFSSTGASDTADRIFLQKSTDGGVTWSAPPVPLSLAGEVVQRPVIAVDPIDLRGNTVYVAFRRFKQGNVPDGIVVVKSANGGKTFTRLPDPAPSFFPFDQSTGANPASFRTNSYPTLAVGDLGTVYVAWSQRQGGPAGQARIVISALRKGGQAWTPAQVVDATYAGIGHQFMPSLTFAAWKLMLAWYDQRQDAALDALPFIADPQGLTRHTVDIRAAEGSPGLPPRFSPSVQVSRYLHVLDLDADGHPIEEDGYYKVVQAEYNHANYPLFQLGTVPFHGDYLEVTPSVRILPPAIALGAWIYNINPFEPTSFHAAWSDNRDVRPPNGDPWGDWVGYNAPASAQEGWPYPQPPACADGSKTGMRNQNIYTAHLDKGLVMGSPGNTKQLDLPMTGDGGRTFVVFVKNTTGVERTLNLALLQIGGVNASFDQFTNDDNVQVRLLPYSSVSCTVYVDRSTRTLAPVAVTAREGSKLVGYVVLNPDPTNLPLGDPDNPFQDLGKETHDPDVGAPFVWNYDLDGTSDPNAAAVLNPRVQNPRVQNDSVVNPRVQNEGVLNPRVQNESIVNAEVPNPRVQNTAAPNAALTDVTWTVTNEGNTTSVFTVDIRSANPDYFNGETPPLIAQVLVYKVHRVPVDKDCRLYETHQDELIVNLANPRVQNPRVQNDPVPAAAIMAAADLGAQDITFYLTPGEQAEVIFRVWDEDTTVGPTFSPDMVIAEAVAQAVNTVDVEEGGTTPPSDVPPNSEPWTTPQPQIGVSPLSLSFSTVAGLNPAGQLITVLNAGGGGLDYVVTDNAAWLSVTPAAGTLTPQDHTVAVEVAGLVPGSYAGQVSISDPYAANNPQRVPVTLTIASAPAFAITTTAVPDGVRGTDYSSYVGSSGGVGDVTWNVIAGALPAGIALETLEGGSAWLVGPPSVAGRFSFVVQAEDEIHRVVSLALDMTVADWVRRYDGPGTSWDSISGRGRAVDPLGNVYVTGMSYGTTGTDYATIKYDPAGTTLWVARYNGPSNEADSANAMAVDALGNVYVTGMSVGSGTSNDFATVKYDLDGNPLWAARYNGPANGSDVASAIAVDASGNVYVTGQSEGIGTNSDFATVKYGPDGNELWVARYNGTGNWFDGAKAIVLDRSGNVFVTGESLPAGAIDYYSYDYATIKYDRDGSQLRVATYNGPGNGIDVANDLALDAAGNVYVTGSSQQVSGGNEDYATVKYDRDLNPIGTAARYNGPGNGRDEANRIALDPMGNIYVTGRSLGSGTNGDIATVKYDAAMNQVYAARYNGPGNGFDMAIDIAADPLGSAYVAGYSRGIGTGDDYTTVKYDDTGNFLWAARYNGPGNGLDQAAAVAIDPLGNIYVGGDSAGTAPTEAQDFATLKYTQSFPTDLVISTGVLDDGYVGRSYAQSLWAFGGSGSRTWFVGEDSDLPSGLDLDSSTGVISGTPDTTGIYEFTVYVLDGALTASKPLSLTISNTEVAGQVREVVHLTTGDVYVPIANVIIQFSGGIGTATTGADGLYAKTVPPGWTGTAVPTVGGTIWYNYSPAYRTYSPVTGPVTEQDYDVVPAGLIFNNQPTNTVVGGIIAPAIVVFLAAPTPGVTLSVSLGANPGGGTLTGGGNFTTDADGKITLSGLSIDAAGAGYTIVVQSGSIRVSSQPFDVINP